MSIESTLDAWSEAAERPIGADLLDRVEAFLGRFVAYPSDHARVAHALWIGHTHMMGQWESTPRIAFLSPEPGSGKSRALEVTEPLVPRPVHAVNTSPAYLFRKVSDDAGAPTILYDEIDTVFGPKARDNEDVRGMLNAGHRRGAMAGRCVVKGKIVETEELPAYCAVALAGLNDLPDTIMTRSVVVRMRRRAPSERVEPWRLRLHRDEAAELFEALTEWAKDAALKVTWPTMPPGIEDRDADVWEALLAVADVAGGAWPDRARGAALAFVADSHDAPPSLGVMLLADLKTIFDGRDKVSTETILHGLHAMDERPWADLRGRPVDSRWLSRQLTKYGVKAKTVRIDDSTPRGYDAADLHDPWGRYLPDDIGGESLSGVAHVALPREPNPQPQTLDTPDVAANEEPLWKLGDNENYCQQGVVPLSHHESATSATSETGTDSNDLDLGALPGRCPACEWHTATMGHAVDCEAPSVTTNRRTL